jgi:hypothetical protein
MPAGQDEGSAKEHKGFIQPIRSPSIDPTEVRANRQSIFWIVPSLSGGSTEELDIGDEGFVIIRHRSFGWTADKFVH